MALGTGTRGPEVNKGVDAGAMTITPGYADTVGSHKIQPQRRDPLGHGGGIEERSPRHLLETLGAGAREAEQAGRIAGLMPLTLFSRPLDPDSARFPNDPDGYGSDCVIGHHTLSLATRLC